MTYQQKGWTTSSNNIKFGPPLLVGLTKLHQFGTLDLSSMGKQSLNGDELWKLS